MSNKSLGIEKYEQEILNDLENDAFVSSKQKAKTIAAAKEAAINYTKRDNRVNVRISGFDLDRIRKTAIEEGIPYQTLLASVIHKFATGRLVKSKKRA